MSMMKINGQRENSLVVFADLNYGETFSYENPTADRVYMKISEPKDKDEDQEYFLETQEYGGYAVCLNTGMLYFVDYLDLIVPITLDCQEI
jgi:hypothetical protein